MAETLPENFPVTSTPAIASYSFAEIASGIGITAFNGLMVQDDSAASYVLTTTSPHSDLNFQSTATSSSLTKDWDLDFDATINAKTTFEGDGYVYVPMGCQTRNTGITTMCFIAKFRKWDGSTETDISSVQSKSIQITNTAQGSHATAPLNFPRTVFKEGDTLRITIEIWASLNTGSSTTTIWHSPNNLDGTGVMDLNQHSTNLKIFVPTVINR